MEKESSLLLKADMAGAIVSFLCAIHCMTMPLLIAILPIFGLGFLLHGAIEKAIMFSAIGLGCASIASGFRIHWNKGVVAILIFAVISLLIACSIDHENLWHLTLKLAGGFGLFSAHICNIWLRANCVCTNQHKDD